MSEWLWDLGVCHKKANSLEIIKDGAIQPNLESVGMLECETNPMVFCHAVDRILTRVEAKALYTEWEADETRRTAQSPPAYDYSSLGKLLDQVCAFHYDMNSDLPAVHMWELSKRIVEILRLDKPGRKTADSRMALTQAEAKWYVDRYGRDMEGLGRVRCKFCAQRSLFRLTLWEKPEVESTQVYRIPGLLFDETIPDGVGLVVRDGAVIGKMTSGTPACDCRRSERVNLGSVEVLTEGSG
ncbi:Fc.00g021820.m01.CDS01 [Cosmosporella sp. VM-42]